MKKTKHERPAGCTFYCESESGLVRLTAWGPPPPPGDDLCRALTGYSESELVKRILDGKYDHLLKGKENPV